MVDLLSDTCREALELDPGKRKFSPPRNDWTPRTSPILPYRHEARNRPKNSASPLRGDAEGHSRVRGSRRGGSRGPAKASHGQVSPEGRERNFEPFGLEICSASSARSLTRSEPWACRNFREKSIYFNRFFAERKIRALRGTCTQILYASMASRKKTLSKANFGDFRRKSPKK